ncbi:MAG: biotin--[acetyl-CoA-carboxylase] ligase [Paludibacteraceae bacterium]|nr:biotin--[acetyl-CoA-carboxylase] ligase [Paludibacteraceae bacterium]
MDSILHLDSVTSTNDVLLKLLSEDSSNIPEGMLVYADEQTKGRGQVGNHWESEKGKNLLASIAVFPDFLPADRQFIITQVGALAVVDFLTKFVGLDHVSVKWPNDVYVGDKKISGTLNEAMLIGRSIAYVVLGVGINLNQLHFSDYPLNPVSAIHYTKTEFDVSKAAVLFRQCLMMRYMQLANGEESQLRDDYMRVLYRKSGYYPYKDENGILFSARIIAVHPAGELELELENGEHKLYLFKQVSYVL